MACSRGFADVAVQNMKDGSLPYTAQVRKATLKIIYKKKQVNIAKPRTVLQISMLCTMRTNPAQSP